MARDSEGALLADGGIASHQPAHATPPTIVKDGDVEALFDCFMLTNCARSDHQLAAIQEKCKQLFQKDYHVSTMSNRDGTLCNHYPLDIIVIERELHSAAEQATSR